MGENEHRPQGRSAVKVTLDQLITPEAIDALHAAGYAIVKVGDVPHWMEENSDGQIWGYRRYRIKGEA